jgi:hypothetical protein
MGIISVLGMLWGLHVFVKTPEKARCFPDADLFDQLRALEIVYEL